MQINLKIDSKPIENALFDLKEGRQSRYIISRSLNLMAKEIQASEKEMMSKDLKVKRPWVLSQIKITKGNWATKTRLKVTIEITPSVNFLASFEEGEEHLPINGKKFLAIPNKKVFGNRPITRSNELKLSNLNLHKTAHGLRGNDETFVIFPKSGKGGLVMQRVGKAAKGKGKRALDKKTGLRMLYTLVKESKRPKKITWSNTANQTFESRWSEISTQVMREALSSPKASA